MVFRFILSYLQKCACIHAWRLSCRLTLLYADAGQRDAGQHDAGRFDAGRFDAGQRASQQASIETSLTTLFIFSTATERALVGDSIYEIVLDNCSWNHGHKHNYNLKLLFQWQKCHVCVFLGSHCLMGDMKCFTFIDTFFVILDLNPTVRFATVLTPSSVSRGRP